MPISPVSAKPVPLWIMPPLWPSPYDTNAAVIDDGSRLTGKNPRTLVIARGKWQHLSFSSALVGREGDARDAGGLM